MSEKIMPVLTKNDLLRTLGLMVPKIPGKSELVSVDGRVADLNSALRDVFLSENLRHIVKAANTDVHLYGPRSLHHNDLGLLHDEWMAITCEGYGNVKTYELSVYPVHLEDGQLYFTGNHLASWLHEQSEGKFTRAALAEKLVYELSKLTVPVLGNV